MKRLSGILLALSLLGLFLGSSDAQAPAHVTSNVLILPFENTSKAPGLEWIGEAFPEVLSQRLSAFRLNVISREDREYAFDHFGLPTTLKPSRATMYRMAEQMDADFVIVGQYNYDGQTFRATAQVLNMAKLHLSPSLSSQGQLPNLIEVQTGLAYDVLKTIEPNTTESRDQFLQSARPIRLDAFENYMRGITATAQQERINRLREAIRLNPQYTQAIFALGKTYYNNKEYEAAASWLARIPRTDAAAGEANFLLGLSWYYTGAYDKAESAFKFLEARLPLTEVENNLGVVASRRGRKNAIEYFQRAVQQDPNDGIYRFNLAIALYRAGDTQGASRQIREAVARRPNDTEARELMTTISNPAQTASTGSSANPRIPLERIKTNYDESSYRQLAMEVESAMEEALSKTDNRSHAQFHVDHGRELYDKGLMTEAERQFREAILRDPTNPKAYAGLALVAESIGDYSLARNEAQTAIRLAPTADAYVVLGRLDLRNNAFEAASQQADRALSLEPGNAVAAALKRDVAARHSQQ